MKHSDSISTAMFHVKQCSGEVPAQWRTWPCRQRARHVGSRHVAAPRANPCARGIDRNNKEGRDRFRHPAARPCAARQTARGIRKHAERRRGTRPRRPARNASARQRRYVPSRNACAYFITVERFSERKSEQTALFLPLANECFTVKHWERKVVRTEAKRSAHAPGGA